MAMFAVGILRELNDTLSALHGSDNSTYGTPKQTERIAGESLDDRLNKAAARARKLIEKGKKADAIAALGRWRNEPIRPGVLGFIPNMHAELGIMNEMLDKIVAGQVMLDESLTTGSEAEQIRYYTVKKALERHQRWPLIVDDIRRRAGIL